MKKSIILLLSIVLIISLCGCSSNMLDSDVTEKSTLATSPVIEGDADEFVGGEEITAEKVTADEDLPTKPAKDNTTTTTTKKSPVIEENNKETSTTKKKAVTENSKTTTKKSSNNKQDDSKETTKNDKIESNNSGSSGNSNNKNEGPTEVDNQHVNIGDLV